MNRIICRMVADEDIYRIIGGLNCTFNKLQKSVFLKYESVIVDEKIAQGGYGTVYRAHSFSKQYALKKMCVNNEDKLENCIQEIFILKNAHCDYILHFIDSIIYQTDSDIYEVYILTDFYSDDLSSVMKSLHSSNRYFDETEILMIMTNIAQAVACLHNFLSKPIIHRDLKVENILIGYPNRYVLCDFGSATLKEVRPCDVNRQDLQDEISQFTTLSYRSPEMADLYFDGGEHLIGRKSDIWAMGVLMYNICFFSLPFGDSILSILSGNFTVPDYHAYSDNLVKIINYTLTPKPEERPNIYQLASLLFTIASKQNPVQNREKSIVPDFSTLRLPIKESETKLANNNRGKKNTNKHVSNQPVATSIIPRDRPKPGGKSNNVPSVKTDLPTTKSENISSQNVDLLVFDSQFGNQTNHVESGKEIIKTNSFDEKKLSPPETIDLMDFNGPSNNKIKQLINTPKSHSLGKNFSARNSGQRFNVYEMISHSYQNVSQAPQFGNKNAQFGFMRPIMNNYPIQTNNPFFVNNNNNFNCPQNYNQTLPVGHRRLVSDPSQWFKSPMNSNEVTNPSPPTILQPQKLVLKTNPTDVLDEFDPLIKLI